MKYLLTVEKNNVEIIIIIEKRKTNYFNFLINILIFYISFANILSLFLSPFLYKNTIFYFLNKKKLETLC
jgi:hypothetical protein